MSMSISQTGWSGMPARAALGAAVLTGLGVGAMLALKAAPAADPALVMLLRFMAVVKAAMVLAAAGGAFWRLRDPAGLGTVLAYALAAGVMAAGPWPIWAGAHVAAGAMLVHGGLIAFGITAWRDRAAFVSRWTARA